MLRNPFCRENLGAVVAWGAMAIERYRCESRERGVEGCNTLQHGVLGCRLYVIISSCCAYVHDAESLLARCACV